MTHLAKKACLSQVDIKDSERISRQKNTSYLTLDNDECLSKETHDCHVVNKACINIPGTYTCECADGHDWDKYQDICTGAFFFNIPQSQP